MCTIFYAVLLTVFDYSEFDSGIIITAVGLTGAFSMGFTVYNYFRNSKEFNEQLESAREEIEAAKAEAQSRIDSLSTMIHEIRNPISTMMGFGQLLQHARLTAKESSYLESIKMSGESGLRILDDILDFSKIEGSGIEMEMAPFRLSHPTQKITPGKGLRILFTEGKLVNRTLISKYFSMLGHPVEFAIDSQDCIERLSGNASYDAIFLDRRGLGIAERIKLGEFGASAKKAKLTLMTADRSAKKADLAPGIDNVVSNPVKLTELKECLESINSTQKKRAPLNALIVEDHALNRQMIGEMVTSFGMKANYANDGVECIEFLESHPDIDLILLDLRMPRMDGWTVARKIRSGEAGAKFSRIPIAVVSAETQSEETCRDLEVDEYISKPFDVRQIRDFVTKVGAGNSIALAG